MSTRGGLSEFGRPSFKDVDLGFGDAQASVSVPAAEVDSRANAPTAAATSAPPATRARVQTDAEKHKSFRVGESQDSSPRQNSSRNHAASPRFLTEDQYIAEMDDGTNMGLPLTVIAVASAIVGLALGYTGYTAGGAMGAAFTIAGGAIAIILSIGLSFLVAKIVSALFGADLGSFGELLIKVSAFVMAYELVMLGIGAVVGPLFGLLFGLPAILMLAVWLIGMDFFQALVFAFASIAIKFILTMVVVGALLGAATTMM